MNQNKIYSCSFWIRQPLRWIGWIGWIGMMVCGMTLQISWAQENTQPPARSVPQSPTDEPSKQTQPPPSPAKPQKSWWQRSKDWMSQWVPKPVEEGWQKTKKKWNQSVAVYRALRDFFQGDEETRRKTTEIRTQQVRIAKWQAADHAADRQALQGLQLELWRRACRIGSAQSCERWRQREPKNLEPLRLLRDLLRRRKQWNSLLSVCQILRQQEPRVLENQLCVADVMRIQQQYKAALTLYRELSVQFPNSGVVWLDWGLLLLEQKRGSEAKKVCLRATERMPQDAQAWRCLGHALRSSDRKRARASYEKSCSLGNNKACRDVLDVLPQTRLRRWWTWSRIRSKIVGRNVASTTLQGSCRMGINTACRRLAAHYLAHARTLRQYQRYSEALFWLRRASILAPQQPDIWKDLGLLLFQVQPSQEACTALHRSLLLQPAQLDLWLQLGTCYQHTAQRGVHLARQAFLQACRPNEPGTGKPEACRKACQLGAKEACYHHGIR